MYDNALAKLHVHCIRAVFQPYHYLLSCAYTHTDTCSNYSPDCDRVGEPDGDESALTTDNRPKVNIALRELHAGPSDLCSEHDRVGWTTNKLKELKTKPLKPNNYVQFYTCILYVHTHVHHVMYVYKETIELYNTVIGN